MIPLPAILFGVMVADALVSAYNNSQNVKASEKVLDATSAYINGQFSENNRYWQDYEKNTGRLPLYPYRTGAVNDISQLYNVDYGRTMNKGILRSSVTGVGTSAAFGYGMYDSKNYHKRKTQFGGYR